MSIPPVLSTNIAAANIAAAIAGTDRAAGAEVAAGQNKGGGGATATGANDSAIEQIEKITKSDLSGDSDADGRQTLDSFERRQQDESETPPDRDDDPIAPHEDPSRHPDVIVNRPTLGGHIDLCG